MNVLSLFDGMSCAQIALNRAGIKYNNYYASEINPDAISITNHNYPNTIQLGDIRNYTDWGIDLSSIGLIIAGFPCQSWSVGGLALGFEDERGSLAKTLYEVFVTIKSLNPKVKFLFENVRMKGSFIKDLNKLFGCIPLEIDSAIVSAQSRKRLYWTNIVEDPQIEDRGIKIRDILDTPGCPFNYSSSGRGNGRVEDRINGADKALTLTKTGYTKRAYTGVFDPKTMSNRPLTLGEMAKLQTVDPSYISDISSPRKASQMLGDGFTVDVIVEILKHLKD